MDAEAWDYIVVGGGSAGATLGGRLSEDPSAKVLLVEAGPDYREDETPWQLRGRDTSLATPPVPGVACYDELDRYFWRGITARRNPTQPSGAYTRGRGLGGSSAVNAVCALRAVREDFAVWEKMGAVGWSWTEMVAAYSRLESDADYPNELAHGASGPIPVYREPRIGWGGCDRALWDAAESLGYPCIDDANAPGSTGVGRFPMNIRAGRRVSTNDGYLEPARSRANLTIRGGCDVASVVLDPRSGRALGVRLADGTSFRLCNGGEVILSAGAAQSPAILMRSGIGPAKQLHALGIHPLADLPVGVGAQDHAMLLVEIPIDVHARESAGDRHTNVIVRYTSEIGISGENDMMLVANNHNRSVGRASTAGIGIQLNRVTSRGSMTLSSADPLANPHFELNLLEPKLDLDRMADGVERCRDIMAHPAFQRMMLAPPTFPRDHREMRRTVTDVMHLCSTARMGSDQDPASVVTPDCRVRGFTGLRVVDASVMPCVVRANINLTVIAMAEHMAGVLKSRLGG